MLKFLILQLSLICCFSIPTSWARLDAEIAADYKSFKGFTIGGMQSVPCKAVQFVAALSEQWENLQMPAARAQLGNEIMAILYRGAGVGGISTRRTTEEEEKVIFKVLAALASKKDILDFPGKSDKTPQQHVQNHQSTLSAAWDLMTKQSFIPADFIRAPDYYQAFKKSLGYEIGKKSFGSQQLEINPYIGGYYLDYQVGYTQQYTDPSPASYQKLKFPRAPIFHPYHPTGSNQLGGAVLASSLRLRLPTNIWRSALPDGIQVATNAIADKDLDIFFVTQNLPWSEDDSILYRPHYWLDPTAPYQQRGYNRSFNVRVRFFPTLTGATISNASASIGAGLSVHSGGESGRDIVSSPSNLSIEDVFKGIKGQNFSLWSLSTNQATRRTALTLHWILNEYGQDELEERIINGIRATGDLSIAHLSALIEGSFFLRELYRFGI